MESDPYTEASYWIPYLRVFFQETFDVLNVEYTDYEFYRLFLGFMKEHGFQWKLGVVVTKMRSQTLFGLYKGPISTTQRYKVLVSDEVSMRTFLNQYNIIDQDGEILIVEEKESNDDTN